LTYAAEFDRAHYPLPLSHDSKPSYETLATINKRLRSELSKYKNEVQLHTSSYPQQISELETKCEVLSHQLEAKERIFQEERKVLESHKEIRTAYESLRDEYDVLRSGDLCTLSLTYVVLCVCMCDVDVVYVGVIYLK
jgi:hypothetical protein